MFLNGGKEPEIEFAGGGETISMIDALFVGGRSDNDSNFEGRIDEVAVFDRALTQPERVAITASPNDD